MLPATECPHAVSGLFHSHPWVLFAFPSRYCALSVTGSYLALEGGPPVFAPGFTCPGLLVDRPPARPTPKGLSPARAPLSSGLRGRSRRIMPAYPAQSAVWAAPASLAATGGISVDFFSSGYLDVSIPRVSLPAKESQACAWGVFPFGVPWVKGWSASPGCFAASRVLHRRPVPRHPPRAVCC